MENEANIEEEEQTIEKIQQQSKKIIFKVNNHLLKHAASINQYIFYVLIIIQALQILWFSFHPTYPFIKDSIGMPELQKIIRYLNIDYYLRETPGSWETCIIIAFVITMVHLISLIFTGYLFCQDSISQSAQLLAKIVNLQIMIMNTILTGPMFNVVATTLYCDPSSPYHFGEECYNVKGIIYCVLACIVGIVLLVQGVLYTFIYYVKNPFSRGCLSVPSNIYYAGKFWIKTLPVIYLIIDPQLDYMNVYIFAFVIVIAGYIFLFRIFSLHTYNQKYFYFVFCSQVCLVWAGLVNIMQFYLSVQGKPNLLLIFCALGMIPLCFTIIKFQGQSKKKIFLQGIRNVKKNKQVAEQFIYMVISLIQTTSNYKNKIQLLGFMKIHNGSCEEESKCTCHSFFQSFYERKKFTPQQESNAFSQFLKSLLLDYIKKYSGQPIFKIIYAYLLYYKLESKIQGVHYITEVGKQKVSFAEEFLIYRLKLLFLQQNQQKENDLAQDKGHAVKVYLQFNQLFLDLEKSIEMCAKNHLQYWRQLEQDFPSVLKLWNLAKYFEFQTKNAQKLFNNISQIYPNNITTLLLYSNFLKNIVMDHKQSSKLNEKIRSQKFSAQSNGKDMNDMKFRQNSNLCIITITTTTNNMGVIINCNSQLQRLLGYKKSEVDGQKITKIMPKSYYDIHDSFVLKYLNRSDKEIQSKQFTVFALCSKGFLVECNILTKLIPQIQNGFHLVGFLKKVEETTRYAPHYIMYDGDNFSIEAVSQTCVDSLGLSSDLILKGGNTQVTANYLFPQVDFEELQNRPQLKIEGFETVIDTRVSSQDYVPYQSFEDNVAVEEKNSGKMNAKFYLVKQNTHGKLKLKFIKFFILNQQQEQGQHTKHGQQEVSEESQQYKEDQNTEGSVNYQRKYQQFVSENSTKWLLVILAIGVYAYMMMQIALVSFDLIENINNSNQVIYSMRVINQSNSIVMALANSNYDTRRLHMTYALNMTQEEYSHYKTHLNESVNYLQTFVVNMIRTLSDLDDKYGYQYIKYFDAYYFQNGAGVVSQVFQHNDALFEFITTGIDVVNYTYNQLNVQNIVDTDIIGNMYFIQRNGMNTINNRSMMKYWEITELFTNRFNIFKHDRQIILGLRLVSVMIIFILILPIIIQLDKINLKLLGIYKLIPIDDIKMLEQNSWRFLTNNFEDSSMANKHINNDIEFEPIKIEDVVILPQDDKQNLLPLESGMTTSKIEQLPSSFRPAQSSDGLLFSIDEQKLSLKRNSLVFDYIDQKDGLRKISRVKLSNIPSSRNQIIALTLIILLLFSYCIGQYFLHFYFFDDMKTNQNEITTYKSCAFSIRQSLHNTQQLIDTQNNINKIMFDNIVDVLYTNIDLLYNRFKDNNNNRQIVYGSIQQLKMLINTPTYETMKSPRFKRIENNLDQTQINIIEQSNSFIQQTQNDIKGFYQKVCYIKFVIEVVVIAILIKILFSVYLQKVRMRTHRSTSMAMMLPMSVIIKNPNILEIL